MTTVTMNIPDFGKFKEAVKKTVNLISQFSKTWMFLAVCTLVYAIPIGMELTNQDQMLTLILAAIAAEICKRFCTGELNSTTWWVLNSFIWISEFIFMVMYASVASTYYLQFVGAELNVSQIMGIASLARLVPLGFNLVTLHFHAKSLPLIYLVIAHILFSMMWVQYVVPQVQIWIMG